MSKAPVPGRDTATKGGARAREREREGGREREREMEEVKGLGRRLKGLSELTLDLCCSAECCTAPRRGSSLRHTTVGPQCVAERRVWSARAYGAPQCLMARRFQAVTTRAGRGWPRAQGLVPASGFV